MKEKLLKLNQIIYPLVLAVIILIIAILNYERGTWLTGWDNVHSEFNFEINFERHFTSAWQEYQGLGLSAGMAHSSDIPRFLIMYLFDIFLPINMVRYSYMIFCLYLGCLGVYFLLRWLLTTASSREKSPLILSQSEIMLFSFLGSLFYLFNLGTLLTFYNPISMFPTQWAYLPWLFLFFFKSLNKGDKSNYFWFAFFSFLATPMAYTPTIFVVYAFSLAIMGIILILQAAVQNKASETLKRLFKLALITVSVNLFWLGPFLYFNFSGGGEIVQNSAINQIVSEDIYSRNQARGKLSDVMLLRGFTMDNYDYKVAQDDFGLMMERWLAHNYQPLITAIGYVWFLTILIGVVYSLFKKIPYNFTLIAILFISIFILLNSNPPIGFLFDALREFSPTFKEALRFPYTKLAQIATLTYAIFFTYGTIAFYKLSSKFLGFNTKILVGTSVSFLLFVYMHPIFQGHFFYQELRVEIPANYWEMFDWFEQQPKEPRIANLPQHNYMNWDHYKWGSRGSGFIWYGLRQPVMDRSFDVWSNKNEQYYNELNHALYTEDFDALESLAQKYHIGWFVYDESVRISNPEYDRQTPFYKEVILPGLIERTSFKEVKRFGADIVVIEYTPVRSKPDYLKPLENPKPFFSTYLSTNRDIASEQGSYFKDISGSDYLIRDNSDFEKNVEFTEDSIKYFNKVTATDKIFVPDYWSQEKYMPVIISANNSRGSTNIKLDYVLPIYAHKGKQLFPRKDYTQSAQYPSDNYLLTTSNDAIKVKDINASRQELGSIAITKSEPVQVHSLSKSEVVSSQKDFMDLEIETCGDSSENSSKSKANKNEVIKIEAQGTKACISKDLSFKSTSILEVTFKYRSATDNYPRVCLGTHYSQCVLPILKTPLNSAVGNFKSYQNFFNVSNVNGNVNLYIILDADDSTALRELELKDIKIVEIPSFSSIATREIDTREEIYINGTIDEIEVEYPILIDSSIAPRISLLEAGQTNKINCGGWADSEGVLYNKEYELDNEKLTFTSKRAISCGNLWIGSGYPTHTNYILNIENEFIRGLPLQVQVNNHLYNSQWANFSLPAHKGSSSTNKLLTRNSAQSLGLDINVLNISRGDFETINKISSTSLQFYPLDFVKTTSLYGTQSESVSSLKVNDYQRHSPYLYTARVSGTGVIELSQAYEKGWIGIGADMKHTQVNGWSNGWVIKESDNTDVLFIYIPQILEFIGYLVIVSTFGVLTFDYFRSKPFKNTSATPPYRHRPSLAPSHCLV